MNSTKGLEQLRPIAKSAYCGKTSFNNLYEAVQQCSLFVIDYFNSLISSLQNNVGDPVITSYDWANLKLNSDLTKAKQDHDAKLLNNTKAHFKDINQFISCLKTGVFLIKMWNLDKICGER